MNIHLNLCNELTEIRDSQIQRDTNAKYSLLPSISWTWHPLPITQEYKSYNMENQERRQHHGHKNTTPNKTPVLSPYPNPVTLVCRRIVDDSCPLPAGVHLERPIRSPLGLLGCSERQEGLVLVWIIYPCARIKKLSFLHVFLLQVDSAVSIFAKCIYVWEIVLIML